MWHIDFSDEAKFYFLDNGDYVFDLLVRIEMLKYMQDAIPPEGFLPADSLEETDVFLWRVLEHLVVLRKTHPQIVIEVVKPLE